MHEQSTASFTSHGSSKITHQSVMKSRLDQKLGERWNGAELSIWKQQKNSSPKVLGITTGEQGQLARSLPGKVTVINVCYLSSGLFCQEDNSVTMQGFNTTYYFCLSVFPIFGDSMLTIISGTFLQVNYFKTIWIAFFPLIYLKPSDPDWCIIHHF